MIGAFIVAVLAFLVWWLVFETEGVYLGRRVVIWLYDLYANRYDNIKEFQPEFEFFLLAQPIMNGVAPETSPLVLDVATGTGRLPLALFTHEMFDGLVIGIDLSRQMLSKAAEKMDDDRLALIQCPAEKLPFPDDTFDVVTCLEALEFVENRTAVIQEMARVLRPGGQLLTTLRINTRWMPGKVWSEDEFVKLLESSGLDSIEVEVWQVDYHKVWARKAGDSEFTGAMPLEAVLRCPACNAALMQPVDDGWLCPKCGKLARVGEDRVIELI